MERQGDEVHLQTDEARGGSTPHRVRWVLAISLLLAIVVLSLVWIVPAIGQSDVDADIAAMGLHDGTGPDRTS